jgi:imidazole glycerol-phosphate synthase subunit HisH
MYVIVIIDYGMGNVGSILNIIRKVGGNAIVSSDPDIIAKATKLILPGVGSFDEGMKKLEPLRKIIEKKVLCDKVPILGICLGMQLMTQSSEEGILPGLGWIEGTTIKFSLDKQFKIPHMGWNYIKSIKESKLTTDLPNQSRFYFVHSYHVVSKDVILVSNYGINFVSVINKENIYGVQFHPEKSHIYGKKLMENFVNNV